jgi:hypothetical protein
VSALRLVVRSALCLGALLASPAYAEDPCAADVKQLCADVPPGAAGVHDCLKKNEKKLSAACRDRLVADTLKAKRLTQEFAEACRRDTEELCAGLLPGGGRIIQCLDEHQVELSPSCRNEVGWITEASLKISTLKRACKADVDRLCPGVPAEAGAMLSCLQANEDQLSSECNASDIRLAVGAAGIVDAIAELTQEDRIKEALEILQGIDSVAFSRSQILFQFDNFQGLAGRANSDRFLFNPQFVFGGRNQFSFQVKVPVSAVFPDATGAAPQTGLGDIITAFAWAFYLHGQIGQYLSIGLQSPTAPAYALGAPWAVEPTYAIAIGLARWISLTTQLTWIRSFARGSYPEVNVLLPEPILVVNLPGRTFVALDTKLGINLIDGSFVPVMKGVFGLFLDPRKTVSISAWYQASLTSEAVAQSFKFGVGVGLAYYFDW